MKKDLKDFYSFLSEELKCENNGVYEIKEKKGSIFRHIAIKKYGNFFVLKQKDEFKAGLFKDAISSCDFIVFDDSEVFFVELKSNNTEYKNDINPLDKASKQCESSKILFHYLCDAYNMKKSKKLDFKNKEQFICLCPQRANQQKTSTNLTKNNPKLIKIDIACDNNGYSELNLQSLKNVSKN